MKNRWRAAALGVLLVLNPAIQATAEETSASGAVSFKNNIVPVLKKRCAICHLTGTEAGNMALHPRAAYGYLVDVASVQAPGMMRVLPGDPGQSYLIRKLEGTHLDAGGTGLRMPFNEPPLDATTLALFREWVASGAAND
ncbi:MAG: hypothetical protein ACK5HY_17460 [Parahaliea sp.]